jgi:NADH dehydrogenase (ubiquinone) Fe-S protein 1
VKSSSLSSSSSSAGHLLSARLSSPLAHAAPRRFLSSASNMVEVTVDGKNVQVEPGSTVYQACEEAGAYVPRFCYHERLSVAGNCRMCLVTVEKAPKPVASCAMPVMPGMVIHTNDDQVKKAREGVMEFLLINHPLDCPVCDQGGECDLQDQAEKYGSEISRFTNPKDIKRTVENKDLGPHVKTVMTRCIHCTRCVRFADEIAGVPELGMTGRGNNSEIGTYINKKFDSEMSGNSIDLCPVGALTSKPYAFTARPWELQSIDSIDVHDAIGSNTYVQVRNNGVMRIVPRLNDDVNEEWIGDKTRFAYDALKNQRLDEPLRRVGDEYVPISWMEALQEIAQKMQSANPDNVQALVGDLSCAESIISLKDLMNNMGVENVHNSRPQTAFLNSDNRSGYLFNSTINGVEDADVIVLVGTNPRMEAPTLMTRIRKASREYNTKVVVVGPECDLAIRKGHVHGGSDLKSLFSIASGSTAKNTKAVVDALKSANNPMVVVGVGALSNGELASDVLAAVETMRKTYPKLDQEDWNGVNFLHQGAANVTALDLGVTGSAGVKASAEVVYLLNADENLESIPESAFVVYQGSHGDHGAQRADIVLPGATFAEKDATYVNTEGRVQRAFKAVTTLDNAKEDWTIVRALSEVCGAKLSYDDIDACRARLAEVAPHFEAIALVEEPSVRVASFGQAAKKPASSAALAPTLENYFMTDAISRNSATMARSSAELPASRNSYTQSA